MRGRVLTVSLLLCAALLHAGDSAWVAPEGGLRVRNMPSTAGGTVAVIPRGMRVVILEVQEPELTISGVAGRWTRVEWTGGTGWVFGGYLAPAQPQADLEEAIDGLGVEWIMVDRAGDGFTALQSSSDGRYRNITIQGSPEVLLVIDTIQDSSWMRILGATPTETGTLFTVKAWSPIQGEAYGEEWQIELVWPDGPKVASWRSAREGWDILCLDARYTGEIRWITFGAD